MRRKKAEGGGLPVGRRASSPAMRLSLAAIAALSPALLAQLGLADLMASISASSAAILPFNSAIIKIINKIVNKLFMTSQV